MKTSILALGTTAMLLTSSLAMAAVGVNHNGPQLNPYAQSNAEVGKWEIQVEEVKPMTRLNPKEVNPLFKYVGPTNNKIR